MNEFEFKTEPFKHQLDEWLSSRELPQKAIFWEQGTGKSKLTIDTAAWLYDRELIDGVLIIAPNGVHRNWVEDEIPDHLPDFLVNHVATHYFQSEKSSTKWHKQAVKALNHHQGLSFLTMSYDAFVTKEGKAALIEYMDKRTLLYVLDEAHYIKNPTAKRTKSILKSAKYAPYRRILTGTPIAQDAFDLYSQIEFLNPNLWKKNGLGSFSAYRSHFGVFEKNVWNPHAYNPATGERSGAYVETCVGYRRMDKLKEMVKPIVSRVTKKEVLDLPEKLYTKRRFDMTIEQARIYREIRDEFITFIESQGDDLTTSELLPYDTDCKTCAGAKEIVSDGFIYPCPECEISYIDPSSGLAVIAELAIVRLIRLQQITCGYLPTDDDEEPVHVISGGNRRLDDLIDIVRSTTGKIIVWARFQLDITLIIQELTQLGIRCVRYDGLVDDNQRAEAKYLFKGERPVYDKHMNFIGRETIPEEQQARVFVGNPAAGSTGLTLTEATTVVYYSNSFKLIDRLQSEDRAHRIGQKNSVLYIDLIANNTVDEKIVEAFRTKRNLASEILGDNLGDWI